MRKIILLLICFAVSLSLSSTALAKSLVVYFSMPETDKVENMTEAEDDSTVVIDGQVLGNVQYVAQVIQSNTASDIFRIEPKTPSRRGAAGSTVKIVNNDQDTRANATEFNPGDQAWYTHFRIGRGTPNRYEGSQFPAGEEALNQFLRQMAPNTGNYDVEIFGKSLSAVLAEVHKMTGKKAVYMTHSQGGRVGWQTDTDNMAAIVAIEPGFAPEVGSETYKKFVAAKIPMVFYFGDYIENGPSDIKSTAFWKSVLDQCRDFAKHYNEDGGDATVVYLPDEGIMGNSHFMFQELNNREIAEHIEKWLESKGL